MKTLTNILFAGVMLCFALAVGLGIHNLGINEYALTRDQATITAVAGGALVFAGAWFQAPAGSLSMAITAKKVSRNATPNNMGGLEDGHYYGFEEDIDEWPAALKPDFAAATTFAGLITIPADDPFVMKENKYFHKFPCSPEEGQVKSTLVGPTDSKAFQNEVSFSNAGNNLDLLGHIAFIGNKNVVVIAKELNGNARVVGRQGYCARLNGAEMTNGAKVSEGNLAKHSFISMAETPCPVYLGAIPLDPTEA